MVKSAGTKNGGAFLESGRPTGYPTNLGSRCQLGKWTMYRNTYLNTFFKVRNMEHEFAKHALDDIEEYQQKGYTSNFFYKSRKLIETKTKKDYAPEQIYVVEERRFEGMSNPSDLSILYVIRTFDGVKGTYLMAYGPKADVEVAEFFKAIPNSNYDTR